MHAPAMTFLWCATLAALTGVAIAADPAAPSPSVASSGWVKSPKNPMLSLGKEGDFDSQNLFGPAVAKEGGKYFLFYCGGPAGPKTGEELVRYQIGLALSDDGETWTKTGNPLMPLGERDNFHAAPSLLRDPAGDVLKVDGLWHMVFCGNRADDVEHATSRDGLTWEKDSRSPIFRSAYSRTSSRSATNCGCTTSANRGQSMERRCRGRCTSQRGKTSIH